jgi:hypothetical protein
VRSVYIRDWGVLEGSLSDLRRQLGLPSTDGIDHKTKPT